MNWPKDQPCKLLIEWRLHQLFEISRRPLQLTEELNCRSKKEVNPNPEKHDNLQIIEKSNRDMNIDLMEG